MEKSNQPPVNLLRKYGEDGLHLWETPLSPTDGQFAITPDGGFAIAGFDTIPSGDIDMKLTKLDAAGNTLWASTYPMIGEQYGLAIAIAEDGGLVMAGWTTPTDSSLNLTNSDGLAIKVNAQGSLIWSKTYGELGITEKLFDILAATNGGFYLGGGKSGADGSNPPHNSSRNWYLKMDDDGNMVWETDIPGANHPTPFRSFLDGSVQFGSYHLDGIGEIIKHKYLGTDILPLNNNGFIVVQTRPDGYAIGSSGSSVQSSYLIGASHGLSNMGDTIWFSPQKAEWVLQLSDGTLLLAGREFTHTVSSGPNGFFNEYFYEAYFLKKYAFPINIPMNHLPDTVVACLDLPFELNAGNPDMTYEWNTGDTTQIIGVSQAGTYTVTVDNGSGCEATFQCEVVAAPPGCGVSTSIGDIAENKTTVLAYPNPFSSHLTLETTDPNFPIESIEVMDVLGRRVAISSDFDQNNQKNQRFSLSTINWQPGIYYIFARTSAQTSSPIKLVKH